MQEGNMINVHHLRIITNPTFHKNRIGEMGSAVTFTQ